MNGSWQWFSPAQKAEFKCFACRMKSKRLGKGTPRLWLRLRYCMHQANTHTPLCWSIAETVAPALARLHLPVTVEPAPAATAAMDGGGVTLWWARSNSAPCVPRQLPLRQNNILPQPTSCNLITTSIPFALGTQLELLELLRFPLLLLLLLIQRSN